MYSMLHMISCIYGEFHTGTTFGREITRCHVHRHFCLHAYTGQASWLCRPCHFPRRQFYHPTYCHTVRSFLGFPQSHHYITTRTCTVPLLTILSWNMPLHQSQPAKYCKVLSAPDTRVWIPDPNTRAVWTKLHHYILPALLYGRVRNLVAMRGERNR